MSDASGSSEFDAINRIAARFADAPAGELWIGDDAAIVAFGGHPLVVAADALVEGVHFDLKIGSMRDVGWKALAVNVSDLAAMGCVASRALVTLAAPPATDIDSLYEGIADAARAMRCPVVGGDMTNAPLVVISVTVLGDAAVDPPPVTRGGARPGDDIWVTGPLGGAGAALRAGQPAAALVRPDPRVAEGTAARELGATAMIDVSDGFGVDLGHLLDAAGVGAEVDHIPVADGATSADALGGGEDYELVWCAPPDAGVGGGFAARGLRAPVRVGRIVADTTRRPERAGWSHDFRR